MRLKDKVTLVTGASRGIGRASCLALSKEGATIVGVARSTGELEGQADDDLPDVALAHQGGERLDIGSGSAPNQGFEGMADHAELVADRYPNRLHADI